MPSDPPYDFAEGVTLELPDRIEFDEGDTYQIQPVCTGVENPVFTYRCAGGTHPVLSVTEDGLVTGENIGFDYVYVQVFDPEIDHVAAYGIVWFTVGDIIAGSKP